MGSLTYWNPGGKHCFGETPLDQQFNIRQGKPDFGALRTEPEAVDLVARMLRLDEARRLPIARVLAHPLWWDASN